MHATAEATRIRWQSLFAPGAALDWAFVATSTWLLVGLHLDGWAHAHRPGLESFFTAWHGILYSGFGAVLFLTAAAWSANARAMPAGYGLTLVGVGIFLVGGAGDMLWHTFLGIEVNVEALLSPTHLMLATGMALIVSGPLRASWRDTQHGATRPTLAALMSAGLLLAVLTFFTQFIQPGGRPWPLAGNQPSTAPFAVASVTPDYPVFPGGVPSTELAVIVGIGGILVATTMFSGLALALLRRWDLPFGALTLVMTIDGALLALMRTTPWWLAVAIAGGLAGDVAIRLLRPREGGWRLRAWAFAFPAALWASYFAALALVDGVWWSVHLWAGAIVVTGGAGVLLSWLAVPSAAPIDGSSV